MIRFVVTASVSVVVAAIGLYVAAVVAGLVRIVGAVDPAAYAGAGVFVVVGGIITKILLSTDNRSGKFIDLAIAQAAAAEVAAAQARDAKVAAETLAMKSSWRIETLEHQVVELQAQVKHLEADGARLRGIIAAAGLPH